MPSLTVTVSGLTAEQIDQVAALPRTVEALLATVRGDLEQVLRGDAAGNPLSEVLGALSDLSGAAATPALPDLAGPLRSVVAALPSGPLADLAQVQAAVEEALGLLGPLREIVRAGDLEHVLRAGLDRALDAVGTMRPSGDDALGVAGELVEFFRLFGVLLGWQGSPPRPEQVVDLLSRALIGIRPDLLAGPAQALDAALGPLERLLVDSADLRAWRGAAAAQLALWQGVEARLAAGGGIDWPSLAVELRTAHGRLQELTAARDRLLAQAVAGLDGFQLPALPQVAAALDGVVLPEPVRMGTIFDGLRQTLRGAIESLDEWHPTDEEIVANVRDLAALIFGAVDESPLGQLRLDLIAFQQRLVEAIESLPFVDLARRAEDALRAVADAIRVIDPDVVRRPLHEFFAGLEARLDQIGPGAVQGAVGAAWQRVEDAVNAVGELLAEVQATLQGAVAAITSFIETARPTIATIQQQVGTVRTTLEGFTLDEPARLVIDELHRVRDVVAEIDVSSLPAPAVTILRQGAGALAEVNLTAEVSGPVDQLLAQVDPTPLLAEAVASLGEAVAQLRVLDPAALATGLDRPIDELLAALQRFGPDRLRDLLDDALDPLREAVRRLDATELLAPVTVPFAELRARVDGLLDPELIFRPLEAAYQPVLDALDATEPRRLIALFEGDGDRIGARIGGSTGPSGALAEGGAALRAHLPTAAETQDALFGYRPGDLLMPVIDLHRKLMAVFDGLADEILEPAGALLHAALVERLRALDPTAVAARCEASVGAVLDEFAPAAVSARLAEAIRAYDAAVDRIGAGASIELSAADRAAAIQVTATLPQLDPTLLLPPLGQADALHGAALRAHGALELGSLQASFARLAPGLEGLLPGFLGEGDLGAGRLRQALRELDPAPIRLEVNALFDEMGGKLVGAQDVLLRALEELSLIAEEQLMPLTPSTIVTLLETLHAALRAQVVALGPATLKDEVKLIFDVVKEQLAAFDPAIIGQELNALRDALLAKLDGLVAALLPDFTAFQALLDRLAALKPSELLATLTAALQPLSELLALLDPAALLQPIVDLVARLRADLPRVLANVEAAFDEVLTALRDGGISGASVNVSASGSIG